MFGDFRKAMCCGVSGKGDTEEECDEEQDLVINSQPINTDQLRDGGAEFYRLSSELAKKNRRK
jgi:hypothetical protein